MKTVVLVSVLAGLTGLGGRSLADETVKMTLKPSGAWKEIGYFSPVQLYLTDQKPDTLKKSPANVRAPLYGVITFGPAPKEGARPARVHHIIIDEPEGGEARLFFDSNGNGDMTDDAPVEWKASTYKGVDGVEYTRHAGGAELLATVAGKPARLHIEAYRLDPHDPSRAQQKNVFFYYRDYAMEGSVRLGDKTYKAILADERVTGDFRGSPENGTKGSGVLLMLDVNADNRFDPNERFDVRAPFNIAGTTYEITGLTPMGETFKVIKSKKTVSEPPLVPGQRVGNTAIVFEARTMDGKAVKFPGDYKGKLVLLDFWATWCGPCMAEVPGLVKAYNKFHAKGLEVLGVTFDNENAEDKVKTVTRDKGMSWPQVYEGKGWKTTVGGLYGINSIPRAFLVDGDTGVILATGSDLRGDQLDATIQRVLDRSR